MKKIYTYLFILLGILIGCNGNKTKNDSINSENKVETRDSTSISTNLSNTNSSSRKKSKKTIYAQYGDIKLDRTHSKGIYDYKSEDGLVRINQPWDGLLIHWSSEKGDHKLELYDKNHKLIKTVDLYSLNPYTIENYPLLSNKLGFNSEYEQISRNIQEDKNFDYRKIATEYRTQVSAYAQYNDYTNNKNKHIVLQYDLIPLQDNIVIGWNTTLIILDSLFNKIGELVDIEYDVSESIVTQDGDVIAFKYGNTMDNEFNFLRELEGFAIYSLNSKELIYEEKSIKRGFDVSFGISESKEGMIIASKKYHRNKDIILTYCFYDVKNKYKYFKDFNEKELVELGHKYDKSKGKAQMLELFNFKKQKLKK